MGVSGTLPPGCRLPGSHVGGPGAQCLLPHSCPLWPSHQALPLAAGAGDGAEDDFRGLVPHTERTGALGTWRGGLTEGVVQEDAEVPELRADLPHQDVGAVVGEGVAGAVEGVVV